MSIRSTVKAIIEKDGKILLTKCLHINNEIYYDLPGGGQNTNETMHDAIIRECMEETGYSVAPVRLGALCEVFFSDAHVDYTHFIYHVFICELTDETAQEPTGIDGGQLAVEWIDIDCVNEINTFPTAVRRNIVDIIDNTTPIFLGSEYR